MWIPSVQSILPKTLLKWATPHCKRVTKFRAKPIATQTTCFHAPTRRRATVAAATEITKITRITKQYCALIVSFLVSLLSSSKLPAPSSLSLSLGPLSSPSSPSALASVSVSVCIALFQLIAQFPRSTVIQKLSFLMNDIRIKSLYQPTTTITTTVTTTATASAAAVTTTSNNKLLTLTALSPAPTATATATATATTTRAASSTAAAPTVTVAAFDSKLFNNNSKNNHRTYNNSSKSNKVFLHYTPRDPRLRITINKQNSFNKHHFESASELKITEDLCNYGELIGGGNRTITPTTKPTLTTPTLTLTQLTQPTTSDCEAEYYRECNNNNNNNNSDKRPARSVIGNLCIDSGESDNSLELNVSINQLKRNDFWRSEKTLLGMQSFTTLLSANDLNDGDEPVSGRPPKNSIITVDEVSNTAAIALANGNGNGVKKRKRLISNESGDSIDSSSTDKKKPEIPDGGYGWVVVFASLVVSLIADGLSFSFGLINTELLAYFKESPSKTAWISSLFFSVPLLMGPIWSNLVDKYGCRKMTILGGVVSAGGFALASLCNSIEMLMLTFGIISGLGLGIGYVTAVVSIAFWFDKKRSFATGIGASGTGIGTFLYAPLTQWLIDTYGWRGATLILAGTMLNACVCGALMRDPDWLIEENRLESRSQSVTTFSNSSVCLEEIKKLLDNGVTKEAVLDTLVTKNNTEANQQIDDPHEFCLKRYRSEIFLPTFLGSQELDSIYEIKSLSRRSLRQKEGAEAPSRENLLSMSSTGAGANPTAAVIGSPDDTMMGGIAEAAAEAARSNFLASIETLSPSEKNSLDRLTPMRTSLASLRFDDDEHFRLSKLVRESSQNTDQNFASSRYSLNENLFTGKTKTPSLSNLRGNGLRHNSVDILSDETYYFSGLKNETSALLEGNIKRHNAGPAIITIPENEELARAPMKRPRIDSITGMRRLSKSKKPSYRSNLRRNISIRNSNFLKDMRIHRNSIHYRGAMLNTHRYRLRASSCPNIYRNSMTTIAKEDEDTWYDNLIDTTKSVFDFSMFADVKFTLFNLSTLFLFIWFIIPYLYLPEYMKKYGYDTGDVAQLISAIGVAQTIGMIGLGYLGDHSWMNVNVCYSGCMLLCGLSVLLMPLFVTSYIGLLLMCILFGFTFASSFSFTPSILVSIVDLDDFTCAYGLVLLVQGVGMIVGPPIAGAIYEMTLRWDDAFYFAGVFIALSGVASYFIEFCEKRPKGSDSDVSEKKANLIH